MKVYLWLGIEDFNWTPAQFQPVIQFCTQHKLDGAFVKVFDGLQGVWYNGQFPAIHDAFLAAGLDCIPYGFHYGNNKGSSLVPEADLALQFLSTYGAYCADMESSWDGQGQWAAQLAGIMANHPGKFYITTWANVGDESTGHHWLTAISDLDPLVQGWMPQDYSTSLFQAARSDWPQTQAPILPALDLSQEDGPNNPLTLLGQIPASTPFVSLWEYQTATSNTGLVDSIVSAVKGASNVSLVLSPQGTVIDVTQNNQLSDPNDSQDKCGPATTAELKYAGLPGKGGTGSAADIEAWEDAEYTKYIGPNTPYDTNGSSIDNMHSFFHDAGNLHYWDIAAISAGSAQSSDIAHIRAAVSAGYPVVVTVKEQSVISKHLQKCPYPWQPALGNVNHIMAIIGLDAQGDYICADQLNRFEPWYPVYEAGPFDCVWASMIQLVGPDPNNPWLKPIPGDDPTAFPAGFNAQNFGTPNPFPPPPTPPSGQQQQFSDVWSITEPFITGVLREVMPAYTDPVGEAFQKYMTKYNVGPLLFIKQTVDWNNQPITCYYFLNLLMQVDASGKVRAWTVDKEVTF